MVCDVLGATLALQLRVRGIPAAAQLLHENGIDLRVHGVAGRGAILLRRFNLLPREYSAGVHACCNALHGASASWRMERTMPDEPMG